MAHLKYGSFEKSNVSQHISHLHRRIDLDKLKLVKHKKEVITNLIYAGLNKIRNSDAKEMLNM